VTGAVLAALVAALCFGASAALMHYEAYTTPTRVDDGWALLRHLVRQRLWLLGMFASLVGLVMHAVALALGPLSVVQPLVVTGLVFSFIFRSALDRQQPTRGTLAGAAATTLGLVLFLTAAQTGTARSSTAVDGAAAVLLLCLGGVAVTASLALARIGPAARSAVLLGAGAGVVFGLIAGMLKVTTSIAAAGLPALLGSWQLYVLAALGACGLVLNQRAYRAFALTHSLPALNAVNPLVALVFGYLVLGERPAHSVSSLAAEIIGMILVIAGIISVVATAEPDRAQELSGAAT